MLVSSTEQPPQVDCVVGEIEPESLRRYKAAVKPKKSAAKERTPFAAWVITLRGELTQEKLSEKTGVSRATIANWERGAQEPDWPSIDRLVRAFPGCPPPPLGAPITVTAGPLSSASSISAIAQPPGSPATQEPVSARSVTTSQHDAGGPVDEYEERLVAAWRSLPRDEALIVVGQLEEKAAAASRPSVPGAASLDRARRQG
jgi:transcriptional regulator with XRE-family HTH domain